VLEEAIFVREGGGGGGAFNAFQNHPFEPSDLFYVSLYNSCECRQED
jgi:hypothetical protein